MELAARLRNSPTTHECAIAADLLESAGRAGASGAAKALRLTVGHRPLEVQRDFGVWTAVVQAKRSMRPTEAYTYVAKKLKKPGDQREWGSSGVTSAKVKRIYLQVKKELKQAGELQHSGHEDQIVRLILE